MKKLIFAFAVLFAIVSNADYLYWMVENPTQVDGNSVNWNSAAFFQNGTELSKMTADEMNMVGYGTANLGSTGYDVATYYIELYNAQDSVIGKANISYSSFASSVFGDNSTGAPGLMNTFNASSSATFNVPEPTSGLLFLVGGMLLGLRRKRRV